MFTWFQHIVGTTFPIPENNNQITEHTNSIWITDFIRLLKKHKVQLKLRSTNVKQTQRVNDRHIMDDIHQYTSSIQQLKLLNACILYLQITFISEITNIAGDTILCGATIGNKTDIPTSKYKWSNQNKPNKEAWKFWKNAIQTNYCSDGLLLTNDKKLR